MVLEMRHGFDSFQSDSFGPESLMTAVEFDFSNAFDNFDPEKVIKIRVM